MTAKNTYEISYQIENIRHEFYEQPAATTEEFKVPTAIFAHASTMQALTRHLIDSLGFSYTETARILGRSVKSIWTSYHQTSKLPREQSGGPGVPLSIFTGRLAPLEALVFHLRDKGFRNKEIAEMLRLSEKTTSTAFRRAEVKR